MMSSMINLDGKLNEALCRYLDRRSEFQPIRLLLKQVKYGLHVGGGVGLICRNLQLLFPLIGA